MPNFGKLTQTSINGNAQLTICFDEQESRALDPRTVNREKVQEWAAVALAQVQFKPPMAIIDWTLKLHLYRSLPPEVWLDVEYT